MSQPTWKNTIAITGAGSGFGAALALRYAVDGWNIAVTDIDEDRARQVFAQVKELGAGGFSMKLDTTKAEDWKQLEVNINQHWQGLAVLVNNAGVAVAGNVEDTSMEDWAWVLDIDLMGVVRGCHQFAAMMKRQKSGHIVNVSSFAGFTGLPFIAAYGVAKAGVIALSEALRLEMQPHGVGVTVVCPAFVKTCLLDTFRSSRAHTRDKVLHWMETSGITAEQVADDISRAVTNKQFLLLTHKNTYSIWRLKRWLPERYFKMISKRSSP